MTARQKVMKLAEQYNVEVEDRDFEILVDAPNGKTWACSPGLHCLLAMNEKIGVNISTTIEEYKALPDKYHSKSELWADLAERMAYGLTDCEDADCDFCQP